MDQDIDLSKNNFDPAGQQALCEELRQAYQSLLNNVLMSNKLLAQETEEDDILSLLLSITRLIIDFEAGAVFRLEGGAYRQVSAMDINEKFEKVRNTYLSEGIYEWAAGQKRTLVMPEGENNTHILVPMITEKSNIGVLDLQIPLDAGYIRNQDLDLLWVVATNASSRCEQIQLNRWSGLIDILLLTLEKVNSSEVLEMLFDSILKGLDQLLSCSKYLLLIEMGKSLSVKARYDDGLSYCIPVAYNNKSQYIFLESALQEKKTVRVPSFNENETCRLCPYVDKRPETDSYLMIVPLLIGNKVHGAISIVDDSYNSKLYTDEAQNIVELFSNQVTIAICQTQLREEVQRKNEKISKEIRMAGMVQQSLLPDTAFEHPIKNCPEVKARVHIKEEKIAITGFYYPCTTLGGDFYDVIDNDNEYNFTLADVSGHGLSSSLITALYKMALHKFVISKNRPPLNDICKSLNTDLCKFIKTGDYITAFMGSIDKESLIMTYSSAGHPYPLYYSAKSKDITMLDANGLPFAMLENQKYPLKTLQLEPGDKILVYTDGITEALSPDMVMYKKERLVECLIKNANFNSFDLISKLYQDLRLFTNKTSFADDISMLLVEIS